MGDIILIGVGIFMILMVLIGLKRGLVKMAFSLVSVVVILVLVNILAPSVEQLLKNTPVYKEINNNIEEYVSIHVANATEDKTQSGINAQTKIIEELPLPKGVKTALNENNNQEGYKNMQVDSFSAYIATMLSEFILGAVTFLGLFVILSLLMRILMEVLNVVAKLPVINTFNAGGGALLGLIEALVVLWILCVIITAFSATEWGQQVCKAIADNELLSIIYDSNPIQKFLGNF